MSARALPPEVTQMLDAARAAQLESYFFRLLETNRQFNLTAIRDEDEAWNRHIVECLRLLPFLEKCCPAADESSRRELLDVGSGGGLPGMVWAIARPDLRVTLLESVVKKARFLSETAHHLGLKNVRVLTERAEIAGAPGSAERERYHLVSARAVAALPTLLELTVPFARVGGFVLAIKGERAEEELQTANAALRLLGTQLLSRDRTATATLLTLQKSSSTPARYPRRVGEPKRRPLS